MNYRILLIQISRKLSKRYYYILFLYYSKLVMFYFTQDFWCFLYWRTISSSSSFVKSKTIFPSAWSIYNSKEGKTWLLVNEDSRINNKPPESQFLGVEFHVGDILLSFLKTCIIYMIVGAVVSYILSFHFSHSIFMGRKSQLYSCFLAHNSLCAT